MRARGSNRICSGRTITSAGPSARSAQAPIAPTRKSRSLPRRPPGQQDGLADELRQRRVGGLAIQHFRRRDLRQHARRATRRPYAPMDSASDWSCVTSSAVAPAACQDRRHRLARIDAQARRPARKTARRAARALAAAQARGRAPRVVARRPKARAAPGPRRMRAGRRSRGAPRLCSGRGVPRAESPKTTFAPTVRWGKSEPSWAT